MKLERESNYDTIKKKWSETCKEVSGSCVHHAASSSSYSSVAASADNPVSLGWAVKATQQISKVHREHKGLFKGKSFGGRVNWQKS